VYHSPNSFFVADFIGSMNHVRGKVISVNDSQLEVSWGMSPDRVKVEPSQAARIFKPGEDVWVGIRPEHMNLFTEQKSKTDIAVRVREIIFRGPEAHVIVQTDGKGMDVTPVTVSIPTSEKITLSRGDLAYLSWPEDDSRIVGIQ
ncbi:MAG: TOBE domain-containing protein, partial [Bdellovibrionales bacterium]|nr:TOBE domain-containing protein [Bdellovibrionales bacterium]